MANTSVRNTPIAFIQATPRKALKLPVPPPQVPLRPAPPRGKLRPVGDELPAPRTEPSAWQRIAQTAAQIGRPRPAAPGSPRLDPIVERACRDLETNGWAAIDLRDRLPDQAGPHVLRALRASPLWREHGALGPLRAPDRGNAHLPLEVDAALSLLWPLQEALQKKLGFAEKPPHFRIVASQPDAPGFHALTERWHLDGNRLTLSLSLLGPSTLFAPGGVEGCEPSKFEALPAGVLLVFTGKGQDVVPALLHAAPARDAERVAIIGST